VLHDPGCLYGLLEVAILAVLLHYRDSESPSALPLADLQDESRIVLTQLAERWRPGVSFLGYFFGRFPSAIARRVRRAQPAGSRAVATSDAADEALPPPVPSVAASPQGPFSAGDLASLPELERQVVLLRVFAAQDMRAIARQLGVSVSTAHRLYRRARWRLEGLTRSPGDRGSAAMRRLVQALHVTAGPDGRLPSRAMAAAGLKRLEYDELMAHLAGAHAIYGRSQRVAGHLAERDAAATLARWGDSGPASAGAGPAWSARSSALGFGGSRPRRGDAATRELSSRPAWRVTGTTTRVKWWIERSPVQACDRARCKEARVPTT